MINYPKEDLLLVNKPTNIVNFQFHLFEKELTDYLLGRYRILKNQRIFIYANVKYGFHYEYKGYSFKNQQDIFYVSFYLFL